MSNNAPFPIDPVLVAIAVAYRNKNLIADDVMPRVMVGKQEFKYWVHDLAQGFTIPDTKVGRRSKPNEVEFTAGEKTESTEDFGLDAPIPLSDIKNAPAGYDPKAQATQHLTDLIMLDREVRVANLIHDASQYAASHQTTMTGSDRIDNPNFDIIGFFMDILDSMLMRATDMTVSRKVGSRMMRHPDFVRAYHGNDGSKGIAPLQFIADQLGLKKINVGEAFVNTARKGQAPNMQRAWQDRIAFSVNDPMADTQNGRVTHAFTAQFDSRIAGSEFDSSIGLRGGERVRVGESVKELITAPDLGYLVIDPLSE